MARRNNRPLAVRCRELLFKRGWIHNKGGWFLRNKTKGRRVSFREALMISGILRITYPTVPKVGPCGRKYTERKMKETSKTSSTNRKKL